MCRPSLIFQFLNFLHQSVSSPFETIVVNAIECIDGFLSSNVYSDEIFIENMHRLDFFFFHPSALVRERVLNLTQTALEFTRDEKRRSIIKIWVLEKVNRYDHNCFDFNIVPELLREPLDAEIFARELQCLPSIASSYHLDSFSLPHFDTNYVDTSERCVKGLDLGCTDEYIMQCFRSYLGRVSKAQTLSDSSHTYSNDFLGGGYFQPPSSF